MSQTEWAIRRLTPALRDDFLSYFDGPAFRDHPEWAGCYCLECHLEPERDRCLTDPAQRRALAGTLINQGQLQGYLVYAGKNVVGWCSANDKTNCTLLCTSAEYASDDATSGQIKAVYCFDIDPAWRGRGIANQLLRQICRDAAQEGYRFVEGYPWLNEDPFPYHGTLTLYQRHGFVLWARKAQFAIVRKTL